MNYFQVVQVFSRIPRQPIAFYWMAERLCDAWAATLKDFY